MKPREYYRGREQTYLKHFFLERYLEKVAYNIGSFADEFVYVDGFSGPWRSKDEDYGDTSFFIAIEKLREVRQKFLDQGRNLRVRCLFIEKELERFRELERTIADISNLKVWAINGEFENLLSEIIRFVGSSFGLIFIDPTGWTGFGLNNIAPVLALRGEVIVNFMYDDINRHLEDARPEVSESFAPLFGGPGWNEEIAGLVAQGFAREDAIVQMYSNRLCKTGAFSFGTSTRILKPLSDRTYFHLVYATRHWKGLVEFRNVEKKFVDEQEAVRDGAKYEKKLERTGQPDMFHQEGWPVVQTRSYEVQRSEACRWALSRLHELLSTYETIRYEKILGELLARPLVWESDVKNWLVDLHQTGEIEIPDLRPRERTPKQGHMIRSKSQK